MAARQRLTRGSVWRRWDPHIHAPGTALNDQYSGDGVWERYFETLERARPEIQAIGVTDYYLLDTYESVVAARRDEPLPNVEFIFPNVELRLATGTDRARAINFHLLIDPATADHVAQTKRFLARLTFRYRGEEYACTEDDLRALGHAHEGSCISDEQALRAGVNQFKVEFDGFAERWDASEWIQRNALIAVATGRADGTAGLQKHASLAALRQKIEAAAHIMFASSPRVRDYWLGRTEVAGPDEIMETYGALKPCLHGSDAHALESVGTPDQKRYSWIKGDLGFEALRQICMEPENRVIVGVNPPTGPVPSNVIASVEVSSATWFGTGRVPLNPGLVGIIGARGSGKTALADMIAAGAFSLSSHVNARSFVQRAQEYIDDEVAHVEWGDGQVFENALKHVEIEEILDHSRVQYLSQQFVETLCSASGATDALVAEIERVIYSAHPAEARQGTVSFRELLDAKAALGRQQRNAHERSIAEAAEEIAGERDKIDKLAQWRARSEKLEQEIRSDEASKGSLITKGEEEKAQAFENVSNAAEYLRQEIAGLDRRKSALKLVDGDVREHRET
ncbi:MAG: ATP-binding protein, partial [Rhodospirillaceae bacterium]|nr:ATP-binding protein [Rhodospirillaceae bacterium]